MLQPTHPERPSSKEGSRGSAQMFLGRRNRIDFVGGLPVDCRWMGMGTGGMWERWRGRVLGEMTGIGAHSGTMSTPIGVETPWDL